MPNMASGTGPALSSAEKWFTFGESGGMMYLASNLQHKRKERKKHGKILSA